MDDRVIDDDTLPPERKSLLPGEGFFIPDSIQEERERREIEERAAGAETVVVADRDADGLACVALIREAYPEAAYVPAGPHEIDRGLRDAAELGAPGARVFVCDLCPDDTAAVAEELEALRDADSPVRWFDHHRWTEETAAGVRELGVELTVGESEEECTADVALRELDVEFPDRFVELAAVTRDHDLWIKEDPRSDDLADYARWADHEEYVATVRKHGVDFPADVRELLADRRVEKEDRIERAVRRAEYHDVEGVTVGVTYGRCSQNEVAETMRGEGADAAVIVKPSGAASIRGSEGFERCHEVARRVNGGGHPKAAGCKPDVYDDMLDYAHHWTTQGATAKRVILGAFRELGPEGPSDDDDATA